MDPKVEIRVGTPEEAAKAEAEFAGLQPVPLLRVTFYGHLVHNPDLLRHLAGLLDGAQIEEVSR